MTLIAYPVIDLAATGRNIRRLRLEKRLTVRDLQAYFGFEQPQAIYKWQSGRSLPTVDNLLALSVLLGVPMEQILVFRNHAEQQGKPCCSCAFLYHISPGLSLNRWYNFYTPVRSNGYATGGQMCVDIWISAW